MTWIQWCLLVPWMPWSCALELRSNVTQPQAAQVTQPELEPLDLAPQTAMKLLVPRHFTHMSPHEVGRMKNVKDEMHGFFRSAKVASFVSFLMFFTFLMAASILLHYRESRYWWQHIFSLCFWILMTMVYTGVMGAEEGSESMTQFARGYFIELILSMENVFVYEMILVSFRVPHRIAKDMLYIVSFFQMFFQLWLFMFVAKAFQSIQSLPYLMGAWLMYLGIDTLRETHDEETSFDPETSSIYRLMTTALGERLVPHYADGSLVITDRKDGKIRLTMMAPVTFVLILVMFWLELDVTLAKIEDLQSHFIGWTSSVFVALALPDLYFIVSEMFKHFSLLRSGISILLIFFGGVLLLRNEVMISDNVEIICMLSIVVVSMFLSRFMGLPPKRGQPYDTTDKESEGTPSSIANSSAARALMFPEVAQVRH